MRSTAIANKITAKNERKRTKKKKKSRSEDSSDESTLGAGRKTGGRLPRCDAALYQITGTKTDTKDEIVRKVFKYVKEEKLRDPADTRLIVVDKKLKKICFRHRPGDRITSKELVKYLKEHVSGK